MPRNQGSPSSTENPGQIESSTEKNPVCAISICWGKPQVNPRWDTLATSSAHTPLRDRDEDEEGGALEFYFVWRLYMLTSSLDTTQRHLRWKCKTETWYVLIMEVVTFQFAKGLIRILVTWHCARHRRFGHCLKMDKNICASEDWNITSPEWVQDILRELCQGGCV